MDKQTDRQTHRQTEGQAGCVMLPIGRPHNKTREFETKAKSVDSETNRETMTAFFGLKSLTPWKSVF